MSASSGSNDPVDPDLVHQDRELLRRALTGEPQAVAELSRRFRVLPKALRWVNRRWGNRLSPHDIEDLAQDIALKILGILDRIELHGTLDSWICRFAQFEFMNRTRTEANRKRHVLPMSEPREQPQAPGSPGVEWGPDVEKLTATLGELDEEHRLLIELKHFDGLTFREMGERTGVSPNTVKARYYRAFRSLQQKMFSGEGDA